MSNPSENRETTSQKKKRSSFMDLESSLRTANFALLAVTALGVVLSGIVYSLSQLSEKAKDRQLDRYKVEAQGKISAANKAAEEAKLKAVEAAIQLEREREERRTLERKLGPRRLSHAQKRDIAQRIAAGPPPRVDMHFQPDLEERTFAQDIADALMGGGAKVAAGPSRMMTIGAQYPLEVSILRGGSGGAFREALIANSIECRLKEHDHKVAAPGELPMIADFSADIVIFVNPKAAHIA